MKSVKLVTLAALSTAMAFGQGFSSLTARITDATGGAIVGAAVEATNLDTSAKRSAASDTTGTVAMNQMVPGRYGIKATMTDPNPTAARADYDCTFEGQIGQRNGIRGDGFFTIDMNLAKKFTMPYKDTHSVQFRWEVYNAPNIARFDINTASVDIGAVGTFGKYSTMLNNPRVMQLSLGYEF